MATSQKRNPKPDLITKVADKALDAGEKTLSKAVNTGLDIVEGVFKAILPASK